MVWKRHLYQIIKAAAREEIITTKEPELKCDNKNFIQWKKKIMKLKIGIVGMILHDVRKRHH